MSFSEITIQLLEGFGSTVMLFAFTLLLALPLGLLISFGSLSHFKPLQWLVRTFVWIIRGTPLMLQVIVIFYVPGLVFNYVWPTLATGNATFDAMFSSRFIAALVAFVINYAAYFSEIYRGGIQSIPWGQNEASQVLGMTKAQTFYHVILPQVIKRILAPMSNEVITLVKDTSLARIIAVGEILFVAFNIMSLNALIWPLFYTGVFYLIFVGVLTLFFGWLEKKLNYYKI